MELQRFFSTRVALWGQCCVRAALCRRQNCRTCPECVPVPWCITFIAYQSHGVPRSVPRCTTLSTYQSHGVPRSIPWCTTLSTYRTHSPMVYHDQSHGISRSVRTSPMVYHDQSHGVSRSVRTSPMVYHAQCVPVPLSTTLSAYQSHCLPRSVPTSPIVYNALNTHQPSRSLRSSREKLLKIPKTILKTFDQRSFLAPRVWNSLPADLRNTPSLDCFKSHLKTHLFRLVFNQSVYVCVCFSMRGFMNCTAFVLILPFYSCLISVILFNFRVWLVGHNASR